VCSAVVTKSPISFYFTSMTGKCIHKCPIKKTGQSRQTMVCDLFSFTQHKVTINTYRPIPSHARLLRINSDWGHWRSARRTESPRRQKRGGLMWMGKCYHILSGLSGLELRTVQRSSSRGSGTAPAVNDFSTSILLQCCCKLTFLLADGINRFACARWQVVRIAFITQG